MKLAIESPVSYEQMKELGEYLRQVQNLRLVLVGASEEEGTKVMVSAEKPLPLLRVLSEIPSVEQVAKKGRDIQVKLGAK